MIVDFCFVALTIAHVLMVQLAILGHMLMLENSHLRGNNKHLECLGGTAGTGIKYCMDISATCRV